MPYQTLRNRSVILEELPAPERVLVFVDDSGIPNKPISSWAGDYHLLAAVLMTSENYLIIERQLQSSLNELGVDEFHAIEIVYPRKTNWKMVSEDKRIETIKMLFGVLNNYAIQIPVMYVSGEQFEISMRSKLPEHLQEIRVKDTLTQVFYKVLVPIVAQKYKNIAIIADAEKNSENKVRILSPVPNADQVYEAGVIETDSRNCIGIQIADFAAYVLNRQPFLAHRKEQGIQSPIDDAIAEGFSQTKYLYSNLHERS